MSEGSTSANRPDLVDAVREVLKHSDEPLTIPKIRARLPADFRTLQTAELADALQRQVAAHVFVMCPKYRSGQDRYWDRSLREHAKVVLQAGLIDGPASWSGLRKAFPKYLRHLAESVLSEELARGVVFRHPPTTLRQGPRYALQPADIRSYLGKELHDLMNRVQTLGFSRQDAREGLLQLLHAEEWSESEATAGAAPANAF